jgi:hypothetical protein
VRFVSARTFEFYSGFMSGCQRHIVGNRYRCVGAIVANAKVTIAEETTGVSHSAKANESGNFTFPDLPPGRYTVSVETAGFKKEVRKGVDLAVNSTGA